MLRDRYVHDATRMTAAQLLAAVGVDFFFFEMDVWMLRSPMAAARQNSTVDMMLALHQVRARRSYYCYYYYYYYYSSTRLDLL